MDTKIKLAEMTAQCSFKCCVTLAPSSPHFLAPKTRLCAREASIIEQQKNIKPIKLQGGLFSGKMSEHFTLIFFFPLSLSQKQTRKTSPPYKNNEAQIIKPHNFPAQLITSREKKKFLSSSSECQINVNNARSQMLQSKLHLKTIFCIQH